MSGMKKAKYMLSVFTAALVFLCCVHLSGEVDLEFYLLGSVITVVFWLLVPVLSFIVGVMTRNEKTLGISIVMSIYYFLWMLFFVLTEPTRDVMGAEHFHVIFAPIVMLMGSPVVLYIEFCARRILNWFGQRNAVGPS